MDQPRVPAGSPEGGQFASKFSAGRSGYEYGYRGWHGDKDELRTEGRLDPESKLKDLTRHHLGKSLGYEEIAEIAGVPKGSRVTLITHLPKDGNRILIESQILGNKGEILGRQERSIYLQTKTVWNHNQSIIEEAQGQGIATEGLVTQVRAAVSAGLKKIETRAAGSPGSGTNGYYTWARLGFVPTQGTVGAAGKSGINLTRLMSTKAGRDWWLANGTPFSGTFDLSDGSISRRVLDAYAKAKGL